MRWYWWLVLIAITDLILVGLSGAGYLSDDLMVFLMALHIVVVNWLVAIWLIKRFLRWLFRKPVTPPATNEPPSI